MSDPVPPTPRDAASIINMPRDAASLIILRRDADGPRLLMGRRAAGHKFMPNVLVFPGGAVDREDYMAAVSRELRPDVAARLAKTGSPELGRALAVAAARETFEEVGLSLGEPPDLGGFEYLCRAITPPDRKIRFDARFFVVDAEFVSGEPVGSSEIELPRFVSIDEALRDQIARPTWAVLKTFAEWFAAPSVVTTVKVLRNRAWEDE